VNDVQERVTVEPARRAHGPGNNSRNKFEHRWRRDYESADESTLNAAFSRRSASIAL
jgi:hypothetical protein